VITNTPDVAAASKRRREKRMQDSVLKEGDEETLSPPDCLWPTITAQPAFDPDRVLLRRIFFIDGYNTKYVSVCFYPARDYQPLVEFGAVRRGGSKPIVLANEHVDRLAERPPKVLCETGGSGSDASDTFRLIPIRRSGGAARLYLNAQYINLTSEDLRYLARMFHIVHKQLRDYIIALPDVLSYVTASLTSTSYIEPAPNASHHINYHHLYEELVSFV
jgi:hypothetical protein